MKPDYYFLNQLPFSFSFNRSNVIFPLFQLQLRWATTYAHKNQNRSIFFHIQALSLVIISRVPVASQNPVPNDSLLKFSCFSYITFRSLIFFWCLCSSYLHRGLGGFRREPDFVGFSFLVYFLCIAKMALWLSMKFFNW